MRVIRVRLSWLIAAWLVCQVAGLTTAPVLAVSGHTEDVCCQGLAPGQTCPMHHHSRDGDRTCKMRSACPRGDAALLSLIGGVGILPPATQVVIAFESGVSVVARDQLSHTHSTRPESPPPRS